MIPLTDHAVVIREFLRQYVGCNIVFDRSWLRATGYQGCMVGLRYRLWSSAVGREQECFFKADPTPTPIKGPQAKAGSIKKGARKIFYP